ncbi:MAG TPA: sugar ABC transporter permease [Anaerolineales bacterium]|nr:sugar ABC transporter permease [Anaerolineales bacterium]
MSTEATVDSRPRSRWGSLALTRQQRRTLTFYAFVSPWLLGFVFLSVFPLLVGFITSLTNYDGLNLETVKFVGLDNYVRAFEDPDVKFSLLRTIFWMLANLPLWLILSFLLALILNQDVKGRGFFRTLFYLPSLIPFTAAVTAWRIILEKNFGMLNAFISLFTPAPVAIGWLSDYSLPGMTSIAIWSGLGAGMVIFLAGLQGIPDELKEAAQIDGANGWQVFRHITLPLMTPVIFFQLVLGLIGSFQQLNLPLIVTKVGIAASSVPPRPIYLYMIHTYRQIFTEGRYGYGTALVWLLTIGSLLLTAVVFWSEKYWVYTGASDEGGK